MENDRKSKKQHRLMFMFLAAVATGLIVGVILKHTVKPTALAIDYMHFPGEMLLRMLSFVSVPLLVTNIVLEVSRVNVSPSRRITIRALTYIAITNVLAIVIGAMFVLLIQPGVIGTRPRMEEDPDLALTTWEALYDLMMNMFPERVMQVCFVQYKTQKVLVNVESDHLNTTMDEEKKHVWTYGENVEGLNMLGLVILCLITGLTVRHRRQQSETFLILVEAANLVIKRMLKMVTSYMPIGAAFLVMTYVCEITDDWQTFVSVGKFMGVVFCGLVLHGAVVLPVIYLLLTRQNPLLVIRGCSPALLKALLLPRIFAARLLYKCCKDVLKIDRRVTQFFLPIADHVSLSGTALYEMAAVIFVSQLAGIPLHWSRMVTIGLTVAVFNIGHAEIPSSGMATTFFILDISGIPVKEASTLLAIEWLIAHLNVVINILGNCIGVALVANLSQKELREMR